MDQPMLNSVQRREVMEIVQESLENLFDELTDDIKQLRKLLENPKIAQVVGSIQKRGKNKSNTEKEGERANKISTKPKIKKNDKVEDSKEIIIESLELDEFPNEKSPSDEPFESKKKEVQEQNKSKETLNRGVLPEGKIENQTVPPSEKNSILEKEKFHNVIPESKEEVDTGIANKKEIKKIEDTSEQSAKEEIKKIEDTSKQRAIEEEKKIEDTPTLSVKEETKKIEDTSEIRAIEVDKKIENISELLNKEEKKIENTSELPDKEEGQKTENTSELPVKEESKTIEISQEEPSPPKQKDLDEDTLQLISQTIAFAPCLKEKAQKILSLKSATQPELDSLKELISLELAEIEKQILPLGEPAPSSFDIGTKEAYLEIDEDEEVKQFYSIDHLCETSMLVLKLFVSLLGKTELLSEAHSILPKVKLFFAEEAGDHLNQYFLDCIKANKLNFSPENILYLRELASGHGFEENLEFPESDFLGILYLAIVLPALHYIGIGETADKYIEFSILNKGKSNLTMLLSKLHQLLAF